MPASAKKPEPGSAYKSGRDAIARGAWKDARKHLERALAEKETGQALELIALAGWWTDDAELTFGSRERAYQIYSEAGDDIGAARVAIWLVWDNLAFRGDSAVASGWLERARRLMQGHERTREYGWLLIREGDVALFHGHDASKAIDLAARAVVLGRELDAPDVEFTGLALEGLARVSAGDVEAGMRRLDEASIAATAGEVKELHAVGLVCCWQIFACERLHDFDRAAQWCTRVQEFSKRWGLTPLSAVCRTQYAGVLIWKGDWTDAEAELAAAKKDFQRSRPPMVSGAIARLADLRRRQGRFDDAMRLYDQAASHPSTPVGRAQVLLKLGNYVECIEVLAPYLANTVSGELTARASALEVLACARAAAADEEGALDALDELTEIAELLRTSPIRASAAYAEGVVRGYEGQTASAIRALERAIDAYEESSAPFEATSARLALAELFVAAGKKKEAERALKKAQTAAQSLGAKHEESRATELLGALSAKQTNGDSDMTPRQLEILRLVAKGESNPAIAKHLKLSQHTVKRHVANLLTRLGLSSRAAAAAYAAKRGLL